MNQNPDPATRVVTSAPTPGPLWKNRLAEWRTFAAAAGAGLAAVSTTDAAIIYDDPTAKPNATLPGAASGNTHGTEVNPFTIDAVPFQLVIKHEAGGNSFYVKANSSILIGGPGSGALQRFQPGQAVTGKPRVFSGSYSGYHYQFTISNKARKGKFTHFSNNHTGFGGFELPASKGGGYAWMRFDLITGPSGRVDDLETVDWAYNNAGGGISAEQGAVPEPSSKALALLALGSAGVLAWRKRRQETGGRQQEEAEPAAA